MNHEQIHGEAIREYGVPSRLALLQEECAELITAVSHFNRGRVNLDKIIEELADVRIMCDSIELCFNLKQKVEEVEKKKLERLYKQLTQIGDK